METIHHTRLTWWEYRCGGVAEHDGVTVLLRKRPPSLAAIAAWLVGLTIEKWVGLVGIGFIVP